MKLSKHVKKKPNKTCTFLSKYLDKTFKKNNDN